MNEIHLENFTSTTQLDHLQQKFRSLFQQIAEGALSREKNNQLPFEAIQALKKSGFGALRVPTSYGGAGVSQEQLFQLLIELAAADSNVVQALRGHFAFVEDRLHAHRTQSQEKWFQRFVQGDLVGNAWTEIGHVALGESNTRVTEDRYGQLIVNGQKFYSTGTIFAEWIDLFAWDERNDQAVIAAVSTLSKGVSIENDWDGFGQKGTGSGTLLLNDVVVDADHIIAFDQRFGYQTAFYQLVHLATLSGIAQSAVEFFAEQVRKRTRIFSHGNAPLVREDAQVLQVIGDASSKAYASRAITLRAAAALDRVYAAYGQKDESLQDIANDQAELESSQAQVVVSELVQGLSSALFNALGASACSTSLQLDRFWRNARVVSSHNPTIYKQKVVGDWVVNKKPLPYVWQIGTSPADTKNRRHDD